MKIIYPMALALCSIIGGMLTALAYASSLEGGIKWEILTRPAVLPIALAIGAIVGCLMSPFLIFCLKDKNLIIGVAAIFTCTVGGTLALNVCFGSAVALFGSLSLALLSMFGYKEYGI